MNGIRLPDRAEITPPFLSWILVLACFSKRVGNNFASISVGIFIGILDTHLTRVFFMNQNHKLLFGCKFYWNFVCLSFFFDQIHIWQAIKK